MLKRLDWNVINEYLDKDLLISQKHPTKDLWILNYSKTTQYGRLWDEVTLSCRGLVVNGAGTIVARPFSKFFNKEEHEAFVNSEGLFDDEGNIAYLDSDIVGTVPTDLPYEVFEKMDGSLGLFFFYDGEWIFASRGSFTSEQALKGQNLIADLFLRLGSHRPTELNENVTYIFEIIYPENRIVVDYGDDECLILLGLIVTSTGEELPYDTMTSLYLSTFNCVQRYGGVKDFDKLKAMNTDNKEGFVIRFSNGFRMKVKFEEYCRLHSIVTNVSNKIIWKHLMEDLDFDDILDRVPDEFYEWVEKTKYGLLDAYNTIELFCLRDYVRACQSVDVNLATMDYDAFKKRFAVEINDYDRKGILFAMFDGKDYKESIWKLVKPVYSTPFKEVVEE